MQFRSLQFTVCGRKLQKYCAKNKIAQFGCTLKALSEHLGVNYKSLSEAINRQKSFPKSWGLSEHAFQKYSC